MQVFIPIMDSIASGMGTQKMNLSLDFTSVVKTTADDKDFSSEDVTEEAPKKEEQNHQQQFRSQLQQSRSQLQHRRQRL